MGVAGPARGWHAWCTCLVRHCCGVGWVGGEDGTRTCAACGSVAACTPLGELAGSMQMRSACCDCNALPAVCACVWAFCAHGMNTTDAADAARAL